MKNHLKNCVCCKEIRDSLEWDMFFQVIVQVNILSLALLPKFYLRANSCTTKRTIRQSYFLVERAADFIATSATEDARFAWNNLQVKDNKFGIDLNGIYLFPTNWRINVKEDND